MVRLHGVMYGLGTVVDIKKEKGAIKVVGYTITNGYSYIDIPEDNVIGVVYED